MVGKLNEVTQADPAQAAAPPRRAWRLAVAGVLAWWIALVSVFHLCFEQPPWDATGADSSIGWGVYASCAGIALAAQWGIRRRWELARRILIAIGIIMPLVIHAHLPMLRYEWLRRNFPPDTFSLGLVVSMMLGFAGIAVICATSGGRRFGWH